MWLRSRSAIARMALKAPDATGRTSPLTEAAATALDVTWAKAPTAGRLPRAAIPYRERRPEATRFEPANLASSLINRRLP